MLRAYGGVLLLCILMYSFVVYPVSAEDEDLLWLYPMATPTPIVFSSHGEITKYVLDGFPPETVREIRIRTEGEVGKGTLVKVGRGTIEVLTTVQGVVCYALTDCRERDSNSTSTIEFSWATPTPHPNRDALVALYRATGGPQWKDNTNWMSDAPIDEWHGVVTGSCTGTGSVLRCFDDDSVASLDLIENGLRGVIPLELSELDNLVKLSLSGNELSGEIPPELGELSNLRVLALGSNALSGEIPPELGRLSNLIVLDLRSNALSDKIPPELGTLANLTHLVLLDNKLSGEVPPELGNLPQLKTLSLRTNQLVGEIPPELGRLSNLELLSLRDNSLRGPVPPELGSLTKLATMRLSGNELSGCIPVTLRRVPDNDFPTLGFPSCDQ